MDSRPPEEQTDTPTKKNTLKQETMEWIRALVISLIIALFLTQVVLVNALVPSGSMEDTIRVNDRVLGNRLAYLFSSPERGDIIIFHFPDDEKDFYVKRIIGMPGEKIVIDKGYIYVNDNPIPLDDPFMSSPMLGTFGPYLVPEKSYFVLGDNRSNSLDSRFWNNSFVHESKIIGKTFFRVFPNPSPIK